MKYAKYQPILEYIDKKWADFEFKKRPKWSGWRNVVMRVAWVKLPNTAIAPNDRYFAGTQFYWDTYFTIIGLVVSGRAEQARQMVDNLCFLFDKFGLVPARNSWTSIGRSQPPFLTRMAWEVYEAGGADQQWLEKVLSYAQAEYERVWNTPPRLDATSGLSRYYPTYFPKVLTGYESGWDLSTRFAHDPTRLLAVDLNCLLYQYEADFAALARLQNNTQAERRWQGRMKRRKVLINQICWEESSGFYYDYDTAKQTTARFKSLAGFYPLWCGVASQAQARRCLQQLRTFEKIGGLTASEKQPWRGRQWDYYNGWPPLQFIVITGLRRYGFSAEAERLTRKWLDLNLDLFTKTGAMWEKYDVVNEQIGKPGRYPSQAGFAWTNGVFLRLLHDLEHGIKK